MSFAPAYDVEGLGFKPEDVTDENVAVNRLCPKCAWFINRISGSLREIILKTLPREIPKPIPNEYDAYHDNITS
jgi:hypothetical protein